MGAQYSGHLFSRLMVFLLQCHQRDTVAYYMGEEKQPEEARINVFVALDGCKVHSLAGKQLRSESQRPSEAKTLPEVVGV